MDRIQFFSPQIYILSSILYNNTVCNSQLKCIKFKDVFSKTTSTGILEERDCEWMSIGVGMYTNTLTSGPLEFREPHTRIHIWDPVQWLC